MIIQTLHTVGGGVFEPGSDLGWTNEYCSKKDNEEWSDSITQSALYHTIEYYNTDTELWTEEEDSNFYFEDSDDVSKLIINMIDSVDGKREYRIKTESKLLADRNG